MIGRLHTLIDKAQHSKFYLRILNFLSAYIVPFNRPHNFRITDITRNSIRVKLPYISLNRNHIKGIHACALATLCEYSTGLMLLSSLDPQKYRIILKNINMTYHYQARKHVYVKFELTEDWLLKNVVEPLRSTDSLFQEFKVDVYDEDQNHICTGLINWQIKDWSKVRTK
jgi:acyl-coenzyme A thioesterase PaaI-like protein